MSLNLFFNMLKHGHKVPSVRFVETVVSDYFAETCDPAAKVYIDKFNEGKASTRDFLIIRKKIGEYRNDKHNRGMVSPETEHYRAM